MNLKDPARRERILAKRELHRPLLHFAEQVCRRQRRKGYYYVVENPSGSAAWQEKPMRDLAVYSDEVIVHMCTQGLCDPWSGEPLRKSTRLMTNSREVVQTFRRCRCKLVCQMEESWQPHKRIEGNTWVKNDNGKWVSTRLSSYCGGYTRQFADNLVRALERELDCKGIFTARHLDLDDFTKRRRLMDENETRVLPERRPAFDRSERPQRDRAGPYSAADPLRRPVSKESQVDARAAADVAADVADAEQRAAADVADAEQHAAAAAAAARVAPADPTWWE